MRLLGGVEMLEGLFKIGGASLITYEVVRFLLERAIENFGDRVVERLGVKTAELIEDSSILDRVISPAYYRAYYSALRSGKFDWLIMRDMPHEREVVRRSFLDGGHPLVALVNHADNDHYWPGWAFSSMLLFTHLEMEPAGFGEWVLRVRVPSKGVGIYNNAGRRFLKEHFLRKNPEGYDDIQKMYWTFLNSIKGIGEQRKFRLHLKHRPLRWVAGGIIPVVEIGGRSWIAFPYRDIPPVGLNHFGGLSQDKQERSRPRLMVLREFLEEFLVLDDAPRPGSAVYRKRITISDEFQDSLEVNKHFKRLQAFHQRLREEQDDLHIMDSDRSVLMHSTDTNFTVEMEFDDKRIRRIPDSYFAIDPYELGIEIDFIYWMRLDGGDYILFGEPDPTGSFLVRAPVVLLSAESVVEAIKRDNLVNSDSPECRECFSLPDLSSDDYRVFDVDHIELRYRRIQALIDALESSGGSINTVEDLKNGIQSLISKEPGAERILRESLEGMKAEASSKGLGDTSEVGELEFHVKIAINTWRKFLTLREGVEISHSEPWGDVARFCPVVWKVLTMAVFSGSLGRFL